MLQLIQAEEDLAFCIEEVRDILGLDAIQKDVEVQIEKIETGFSVHLDGESAQISYSTNNTFLRALGLLVEHIEEDRYHEKQQASFETLGAMLDCSRNAVMRVESVKRMIRHMALMGFNMLQIYTEETYEVEGHPYFGYMRGRYTADELKELDDYAFRMGVELMPCIQTLAHLGCIFRWRTYNAVTDCDDILLVGDEKTYELIDAMFATFAKSFRSRRINIGMDEAHMLGLGKYLEEHGYENRSEIMITHLAKVIAICKKYGFQPSMWSDMFFRLATNGLYYSDDLEISKEVIEKVPSEVGLIYWDYYSTDDNYDRMLSRHLQFKSEIWFAGGSWRWRGFAPQIQFSNAASRLAVESCRRHGVKHVFVTAWGDDGSEASMFTILPTLQLYAEECFAGRNDDEYLAGRFAVCAGANWTDFLNMDLLNLVGDNEAPGRCGVNPAKYFLYQDPLSGLFDKHVSAGIDAQYAQAAAHLKKAAANNPSWAAQFTTLALAGEVLSVKAELGVRIHKAYAAGDRATLQAIAEKDIPAALHSLQAFAAAFKKQWFSENKAFGYEIIDIRLGGLRSRLETAASRIQEYLSGEIDRIEELEAEQLYYDCRTDESLPLLFEEGRWSDIISGCRIAAW